MKKKDKKERFEAFRNFTYALKTVTKASPSAIPFMFFEQFSYWFFSEFIMQVLFFKTLLSIIEGKGTFREYMINVLMFVGAGIIAKAIEMFSDYYIVICDRKIYRKLNEKIFKQAGKIDIECYENPEFYDKYTRATEIVIDKIFKSFYYDVGALLSVILTLVCLIVYVSTVDAKLLLILLTTFVAIYLHTIENKIKIKKDKEMTPNKREKSYVQRVVYLKEYSKDMRTSGIFKVMYNQFGRAVKNNREIIKKYGTKIALIEIFVSILSESLPIVATYLYAGYRFAIKKNLSVGDFSVVVTAVNTLRVSIGDFMYIFSDMQKAYMQFGFLREFLEYEPKVLGGDKEAEKFESIEFKNVSFKYPSSDRYSLKNVNLKISSLDRVAIVGKNGAGKSTFVKLLLRFYDPTEGEILYNGVNVLEYDIASLRNRLATVFQNYKVYALSVDENVLCREVMNDEDRALSEKTLKMSGAYDKIKTLPDKSATVLTREFDKNGTGLSGGEQQKVAASRMFAKNFDLAILDEPSSALDPIAEYKMYESIISETENKSVIFISHRLSSAVLSNKIFVFDDGKVIESGTHEELMSKGGTYAEMFTMQASNYNEEAETV